MWVLRRENAKCLFKSILICLKDWMIDVVRAGAGASWGALPVLPVSAPMTPALRAHLVGLCVGSRLPSGPGAVSLAGAPKGRPPFQSRSQSQRLAELSPFPGQFGTGP